MSTLRRRITAVSIIAVVVISGIYFGVVNRRCAANAVGDAIRGMSGVSAAAVRYQTSITNGSHFDLQITLSDTASAAEAAAVGRAFVNRIRDAYFPDFKVSLHVAYKADPAADAVAPGARADFDYSFDLRARGGPSSSDVADSLAMWLQIAQSPATVGVRLGQPAWAGPDNSRDVTVFLAPAATDAAIAELIHEHPDLATATWEIDSPPPERFRQLRSYRIRGPFPSQQRRELWRQIVDQIGSADARASTDTVDLHAGVPPTSVEISVSMGPRSSQQFADFARAVTALLPGLGLPIAYRLFGLEQRVEFTLGGCDRPDPRYPPSALESELRQQYQHC